MTDTDADAAKAKRKHIADTLALATLPELNEAWQALPQKPVLVPVRGPETGLVMVRAKTGGTGQPFNLGEVAISRATVMIEGGPAGHAHVLGNQLETARLAAAFDALAQLPGQNEAVTNLLERIVKRASAERGKQARQTAATRVDFFTMVRGED